MPAVAMALIVIAAAIEMTWSGEALRRSGRFVSPIAFWTYGCRMHAVNDVEQHVLRCLKCERLLDEIEESLNEIAGREREQAFN
jgi:hypothetical protein